MAPGKVSSMIVNQLHTEIVRILKMPEVTARVTGDGAMIIGNSPQEFAAYIKADMDKWAKVIRTSGIIPD